MERGRVEDGPPLPAPGKSAESFIRHVEYRRGLSREGPGYNLLRLVCPVDVAAGVEKSCGGVSPIPARFPAG